MGDNNNLLNTGVGHFLTNPFGEQYLHSVNRNTFSDLSADTVFRRHFGTNLEEEDTLNIIVGTDSGLLVDYIQKHGVPAGSRFIFIELSDVLDVLSSRLNDQTLDKRIALCRPEDWRQQAQNFSFDSYLYVEKVQLLKSLAAADAFLPAYRDLHRSVKSDLDTWAWGLRGELGSSAFFTCQLDNVAENQIPAIHLKNRFVQKTAVILAGGPSLDEILPWVKEHRHEIVVLAVSRICRQLLKENIQPHIIFSIDPTSLSFDISKEMLLLDEKVLFINADHVNPNLLGQWRGRHAYLGERLPWISRLNVENLKISGPTVTNSALALAIEMGFDQIVLGGVDLCHSPDGFSHASGSDEHQAGPFLGHVGQWVETNAGEIAETEESLAQAVNDIGAQAMYAQSCGCLIINPARNAAKIPHVLHLPLAEVDIVPLDSPAEEVIASAVPDWNSRECSKYYQQVLDELTPIVSQIREVKKLAQEALECNAGLFGRDGKQADFKYKIRMDKIESQLDSRYKKITPLIKKFGIRHFLRVVRPDRSKEWQDEEIEQTGKIYYESYVEGANALLATIDSTKRRLKARLEEEKETPEFSLLVKQWRDDNQPGRVGVWVQHHPNQNVPSEYDPEIHALLKLFEEQLSSDKTQHAKKCQDQADLSGVQSKAIMLFKHRDLIGLHRLVAGVKNHNAPEAPQYFNLISGYLAELEDRDEDAIQHYQSVGEGTLLEDALRRICSLTLKYSDYDNAVLALDCLSSISPDYMSLLAELYKITGNYQKAADIFTEYLEKVPDDVVTLLKLGQLYSDQGITEGAQWAYDYVLQIDPENQVARIMLKTMAQPMKDEV